MRLARLPVLFAVAALLFAPAAFAQPERGEGGVSLPAFERGGPAFFQVGIRASVENVDEAALEAELGVTMYELSISPTTGTRGIAGRIGTPYYGVPALDYGDGSTVSTTVLPLASPNGGPNGTNVYRATGFTHTYPGSGFYDPIAATGCCAGATGSLLYRVYSGTSFVGSYGPYPISPSTLPTIVTGNPLTLTNLTFTTTFFYTSFVSFNGVLRYAVTNGAFDAAGTRGVSLGSILDVPTASDIGLFALGLLLLAAGVVQLRR